jgi:GxxExxY protein
MKFDDLSNKVIGCALKVHKELGPGLLESAYEQCLCYELSKAGIQFERQKELPVKYQNVEIDCGYRINLLVEGKLIIELKSVDELKKNPRSTNVNLYEAFQCKHRIADQL